MKKLITVAVAIVVLALAGVANAGDRTTIKGWPACVAEGGPGTFLNFIQAIARQDEFAIQFYMSEKGCAAMRGDIRAEILGGGKYIVLVRLYPEGFEPSEVWTVPGALK